MGRGMPISQRSPERMGNLLNELRGNAMRVHPLHKMWATLLHCRLLRIFFTGSYPWLRSH